MAMAATGSVEFTEKVAAACGKELKLAGINWSYSPVADVNSDPRNPVIGVRSFGDGDAYGIMPIQQEMGYRGVIVTDCLDMEAIASPEQGGCGVEEGAVRSLEAGADIAMICHTMKRQVGAIEAVWAAAQNGRLKIADVKEARERVGRMKDLIIGGWDGPKGMDGA
ncbi:hypothetical protein AX15_007775 [Amanita polypyramis BW_CC]|nr:hypothetical protein AX15_007775 [Amanita polypyramis BW_CC]